MTGMPRAVSASVSSGNHPSSFTACVPAFRNRPALRIPSSIEAWYDRNGRSPTMSGLRAPRTTARV